MVSSSEPQREHAVWTLEIDSPSLQSGQGIRTFGFDSKVTWRILGES